MNALKPIEDAGNNTRLYVPQLLIQGPGICVFFIGVHSKVFAAMRSGIVFIKCNKSLPVAFSHRCWGDYQRMKYHDVLVGRGIVPVCSVVDIHLLLVDDPGSNDLAVILLNKQIAPFQCHLRGDSSRIDSAFPTNRHKAVFLGSVNL